MDFPPIIEQLAALAAKHKLVPFLGAGCSKPHLSHDWSSLITEIATAAQVDSSIGNLEVAQRYVQKFGKVPFVDFLKQRLMVTEYEDAKGDVHLGVMSLGLGVVYTTNQDNVFETCGLKYGRHWRPIVNISDIAEARPGDQLYYKYHGDLLSPDSIVFTTDDYDQRVRERAHFLNIRLRSDLLTKSLLFLGYSFQDDTIRELFRELRAAFGENLPPSFLVAYVSSDALVEICSNHSVELIDPVDLFKNQYDAPEAFERFITLLVTATTHQWRNEEIRLLFDPAETPPTRVVSRFEVEAIEKVIPTLSIADAVERFRVIFDTASIPIDFESRVVGILAQLAERATTHEDTEILAPILFNLELQDIGKCFEASAAIFSIANVRKEPHGYDLFNPMIRHGLLEAFSAIIVAAAIEFLHQRGQKISKAFRYHANQMYESGPTLSELPDEHRKYILHWFDVAWTGTHDIEHPVKREQRLGQVGFGLRRSFKEIHKGMLNSFPRIRLIPPTL